MEALNFKVWILSIYLVGGSKEEPTRLFSLTEEATKSTKILFLKYKKLNLNIGKNTFTVRIIRVAQGAQRDSGISILEDSNPN